MGEEEKNKLAKFIITALYECWADQHGVKVTDIRVTTKDGKEI